LQEMIMLQQTQSFGPVLILTQRHAQNWWTQISSYLEDLNKGITKNEVQ
jgi:hypothetical protein